MAFEKKNWLKRIVQYPGRRILTPTGGENEFDVSRHEGTVSQNGDGFTAENMNDLEERIYNAILEKLDADRVLTEEEWNTGTVSQRGYLADAKDILDEFAQLNTDIGNRIRCIRDTPRLTNVPAGYSEQSVSLSNISGTVVGTAARVTSYASGGGYLCVTLNGSNAWIEAEKAQKSISLEILRFYTN